MGLTPREFVDNSRKANKLSACLFLLLELGWVWTGLTRHDSLWYRPQDQVGQQP